MPDLPRGLSTHTTLCALWLSHCLSLISTKQVKLLHYHSQPLGVTGDLKIWRSNLFFSVEKRADGGDDPSGFGETFASGDGGAGERIAVWRRHLGWLERSFNTSSPLNVTLIRLSPISSPARGGQVQFLPLGIRKLIRLDSFFQRLNKPAFDYAKRWDLSTLNPREKYTLKIAQSRKCEKLLTGTHSQWTQYMTLKGGPRSGCQVCSSSYVSPPNRHSANRSLRRSS